MNRRRLAKLEKALLDGTIKQETFDIGYWCTSETKRKAEDRADVGMEEYNEYCDTVGCVIGNSPRVFPRLFKKFVASKFFPNWKGFSDFLFDLEYDEWFWCFDAHWYEIDNTTKGAALRIRYLLDHGLPKDSWEQINGLAPYLFQKELDEAKQ